jgi:gamma-glutamyltranspeptidase / glutathione hydrolase
LRHVLLDALLSIWRRAFTVGAPGGAWIGPAVLQVLLNVLDWGMPAADAVASPRSSATSDAIDISNKRNSWRRPP